MNNKCKLENLFVTCFSPNRSSSPTISDKVRSYLKKSNRKKYYESNISSNSIRFLRFTGKSYEKPKPS